MAKRKSKTIPTLPPTSFKRTIGGYAIKILFWTIHLAFAFSLETCLHPLRWLLAMAIRGFMFYEFSLHDKQFYLFFTPIKELTVWSFIFDMFICMPMILFVAWWYLTTLLMFVSALYGRFGYYTKHDSRLQTEDYKPIRKFLDWRNNKMRFMDYESSSQMLRDTAILNNLEAAQNDPEVKKTLDFVSNKMRFMGYPDALEFLKGKK